MSILVDPEIQVTTYWTIERLTLLATWLTAFGTIGATIVALWFGFRSGRTKLKVKTEFDKELSISVTNLSHRLVTITQISWRVGRKGNRQWVRSPASSVTFNREGSRKLEPGDVASFYIHLGNQSEPSPWLRWIEEYVPHLDKPVREHIDALCLKIHTSVGYTKKVAPGKDFLIALEEAIRSNFR